MDIQLHKDGDTIIINKNGWKGSASLSALSGRTKTQFKDEFSVTFKGLTDEVYTFVSKHSPRPKTKAKSKPSKKEE